MTLTVQFGSGLEINYTAHQTPLNEELIYCTNSKKLYVNNGTTISEIIDVTSNDVNINTNTNDNQTNTSNNFLIQQHIPTQQITLPPINETINDSTFVSSSNGVNNENTNYQMPTILDCGFF